jgi:hypothetical protein
MRGLDGVGVIAENREKQKINKKSTAFHSAQDPGAEIAPENIQFLQGRDMIH